MPNYAQPFGTAGAAAGGVTGAGLLGALGSALDTPRQALWNLVRKPVQAVENGDWSELLGAVPGAAGAVLGGLVGGPLGILAGSALGGVLQGAGKATGMEQFDAPEVSDLTGTDEMLPNLLVGALTDPLTFAGGIGGANRGRQAGQAFGRNLEQAAIARGPMYQNGAETLTNAMKGIKTPEGAAADYLAPYARNHPGIMGEIAPGSTYLGGGAESLVLQRPDGGVTMLRGPSAIGNQPPLPRAAVEEMLPAARSRMFDGDLPIRVEHSQMANVPGFGREAGEGLADQVARKGNMGNEMNAMRDALDRQGLDFWDAKLNNVGFDRSGQLRIVDPGALIDPSATMAATKEPTMIQNALLRLLGSDKAIQRELSAAVAGPRPPIPRQYYRPQTAASVAGLEATPVMRVG